MRLMSSAPGVPFTTRLVVSLLLTLVLSLALTSAGILVPAVSG